MTFSSSLSDAPFQLVVESAAEKAAELPQAFRRRVMYDMSFLCLILSSQTVSMNPQHLVETLS